MTEVKPQAKLALILLACLFIRVGYQLLYVRVLRFTPPFSDPHYRAGVDSYEEIALNLLEGKGYSWMAQRRRRAKTLEPTAVRVPLYPLTLFLVYKTFGVNRMAALFLQAVFDTVTCFLIFLLAGKLFDNPRIPLLSSFLWCFYLPEILITRRLYSEPMFTMLLIGSVILGVGALGGKKPFKFAVAGLGFGAAALCRPIILPFPLLWLAVLILKKKSGDRKNYLFLLPGFMLVLAPWVIRNYKLFGSFIPGTTHEGYTLYSANLVLENKDHFKYFTPPQVMKRINRKFPLSKMDPEEINEARLDKLLVKESLRLIASHPGRYLAHCLNRFFLLWFNLGRGREIEMKWIGYAILSLFLVITAVIGFRGCQPKGEGLGMIGLLAGFLTAVPVFSLAHWRFTIPVFPYILIFSSACLVRLPFFSQKS